MSLPADLVVRAPEAGDVPAIASLVGACDATYRDWAPPGWEPPPPGRELDRWRGRVTDGSWWTRVAFEPDGRAVGLVCFTQAVSSAPPWGEPIPGRAHVSAMFTHPDRWREGIGRALLDAAEAAMRAARYAEAQLWTPEQAPARAFYEALGWTHDGRRQWLDDLSLPIVAYVKGL
jgi:GNAT superfamily N-acetyltransferase